MSQKILIDSIYSAAPAHCSSAVKMWRLVDYVLNERGRTDVFFYWLIPDDLEPEDFAFYPVHENVKYIPIPYHKRDRTRDYQVLPKALDTVLGFNGDYWDFDILITNRTTLIPLAKVLMNSPRDRKKIWTKKVFLFEEMPLMGFKPTVALSHVEVQEQMVVLGHLAADLTSITISHERDGIISTAKKYTTPFHVQSLRDKIKVTSPAILNDFQLKAEENRYGVKAAPFTLAFVGRVSATDHIREVYDTMVKHWIIKGDDKIRLMVSTVTTSYKVAPPDMVEYINAPRDLFWKLLKTDMDCILCLSEEAGFGMSLMEPLMFGTPVVLIRAKWSEALVGKDYPLFVDSETKAYAMVKAVYDDYPLWYARFAQWQKDVMRPMFSAGGIYEHSMYPYMYEGMLAADDESLSRYRYESPGKGDNSVVQALIKGDPEEFYLFDRINQLGGAGELGEIKVKTAPGDRDKRGLIWATNWNDIRLALKAFHGYEDASTATGHFRKVK